MPPGDAVIVAPLPKRKRNVVVQVAPASAVPVLPSRRVVISAPTYSASVRRERAATVTPDDGIGDSVPSALYRYIVAAPRASVAPPKVADAITDSAAKVTAVVDALLSKVTRNHRLPEPPSAYRDGSAPTSTTPL